MEGCLEKEADVIPNFSQKNINPSKLRELYNEHLYNFHLDLSVVNILSLLLDFPLFL